MATAMVAYEAAVDYAKNRPQGRKFGHPAESPVVNIVEHADVRRMLLKQKAISEGALALLLSASRYLDIANHGQDDIERNRCQQLLDLLTPVAKTFPAEKGFESNALSVQVHGGYGYTSEYLPESWLRDQKLNSIHEGTTGIQSMDLLGRKVLGNGGASLKVLQEEVDAAIGAARKAGVTTRLCDAMATAMEVVMDCTMKLGARAAKEPEAAFAHSADYLEMFGSVVVAWQWLRMASVAAFALQPGHHDEAFYQGKLSAAHYFFDNELPRALALSDIITGPDKSYLTAQSDWF
jgi:butyryl-CoA dehydrogenase